MNSLLVNYIVLFWSFLLVALFMIFLIRAMMQGRFFVMIIRAFLFLVFFWSRFIEPQKIVYDEITVDLWVWTTIALISDTHLWVFKDQNFLQKVVDRINDRPEVGIVLIAGDLLYNPTYNQSLETLFAPLASLRAPVYAVLWNHDVGVPWDPFLRLPLTQALEAHGVTVMKNDIIWINNFFLVWMAPYLSNEADVSLLERVEKDETVVVLTHNPDTITNFPNDHADLTLVWHTHCGQIRIPLLYNLLRSYIVPVTGDFDCGLTQEATTRLYITPWVWEVLLPMRLLNPPTISLISI